MLVADVIRAMRLKLGATPAACCNSINMEMTTVAMNPASTPFETSPILTLPAYWTRRFDSAPPSKFNQQECFVYCGATASGRMIQSGLLNIGSVQSHVVYLRRSRRKNLVSPRGGSRGGRRIRPDETCGGKIFPPRGRKGPGR